MRVVKIGGRAQDHPGLAAEIAAAWHAAPGAMCLVHGGGDEVTALQQRLGVMPAFIDGRRVTSETDIDVLRMALSGSANKRIVAALVANGVRAVGISGEDAALISARPLDAGRLGRVGRPDRIEVPLLWTLLDAGFLPVISPLGRDRSSPDAGAINVNADDAAAAIAVALGADELLLIADVAGVLDETGVALTTLDTHGASAMLRDGTATSGMRAKLQAATFALDNRVRRVRIGDLAALRDSLRGTALTFTPTPSFA